MHACDDKIPYASRREAAMTVKGTSRRGYQGNRQGGPSPRPYHCAKCGLWHLGREPSKKDRAHPYFRAAQKYMKRRFGWWEETEDWSPDPIDIE